MLSIGSYSRKIVRKILEYFCPVGYYTLELDVVYPDGEIVHTDTSVRVHRQLARDSDSTSKHPFRYCLVDSIYSLTRELERNNERRVGTYMSVLVYSPASDIALLSTRLGVRILVEKSTNSAPTVLDRMVIELESSTARTWRELESPAVKIALALRRVLRGLPLLWHSGKKSIYVMFFLNRHITSEDTVLSRIYTACVRYVIKLASRKAGLDVKHVFATVDTAVRDAHRVVRLPLSYRGDVGSMSMPLLVDEDEERLREVELDEYARHVESSEPPILNVDPILRNISTYLTAGTEEPHARTRSRATSTTFTGSGGSGYRYIEWLLSEAPPLPDWRHRIIAPIIAPYIANVLELSLEDGWRIVERWLERCGVDPYRYYKKFAYEYRHVRENGLMPPTLRTLLEDSRVVETFGLHEFVEWLRRNYPDLSKSM